MSNKMALDALTEFEKTLTTWANAYPETVFPEPDLAKAAKILQAGGMTLDSISADAMRYTAKTMHADFADCRAAIAALQAEEVERLAAQAAPTDEEALRQLMGMNEAAIDAELLAAGISPDDAVKRADRAIKGALATVRAERRAIEYGDIVHKQVVAMRAAVVAAKLESPEVGIQWIANTLFGPGHYPDIEAARELGGAQALFDKEMAEHEAFRAAHPAPVAAQPSQAPVVQAGEYPPRPFDNHFDQAFRPATTAQAVRMLTEEELTDLIASTVAALTKGQQ